MIDFFTSLFTTLNSFFDAISQTADNIDAITFSDSIFTEYLGYAKYAMGSPLYTLFTSILLIAVGFAIWNYLLKGIYFIRGLF